VCHACNGTRYNNFRKLETYQLLGLLIVVALALHANTHAEWDVADSLVPHKLVQARVDANVGSLHLLGNESLDLTHSTRRALLEATARQRFMIPTRNTLDAQIAVTISKHRTGKAEGRQNQGAETALQYLHAMKALVQVDSRLLHNRSCKKKFSICP